MSASYQEFLKKVKAKVIEESRSLRSKGAYQLNSKTRNP